MDIDDCEGGKPVKRNVILLVLLMAIMPTVARAEVVADTHFNALSEGGVTCGGYSKWPAPTIATVPGSPDPSKVLQVNFPDGFGGGFNTMYCSSTHYDSDDTYAQVYVYFPADYQFHTTANKIAYSYLSESGGGNPGNLFMGVFGSDRQVVIQTQPVSESKSYGAINKVYYNNRGYVKINTGTWYKLTYYVKLNTSGMSNGIIRIWVNDTLVSDYTDMNMRGGIYGARNFYATSLMPIWGGLYQTKSSADYFYMDRFIVSSTPISGVLKEAINKEPNPPNTINIK